MKFNCLSPARKMIIYCVRALSSSTTSHHCIVDYTIYYYLIYNYNTSNEIECNLNGTKNVRDLDGQRQCRRTAGVHSIRNNRSDARSVTVTATQIQRLEAHTICLISFSNRNDFRHISRFKSNLHARRLSSFFIVSIATVTVNVSFISLPVDSWQQQKHFRDSFATAIRNSHSQYRGR